MNAMIQLTVVEDFTVLAKALVRDASRRVQRTMAMAASLDCENRYE